MSNNIVMPKNSALDDELKAVLEIYNDVPPPGWLSSEEYTPKLMKMIGEDQYRSSYNKKAQIPAYYGFVEWQDYTKSTSPRRITESGRNFYLAWKNNDTDGMYEAILNSLETCSFGRDNLGSPSSNSDVQPPNLCIRAILDLGNIKVKEFAYLLWRIADRFSGYTETVTEIKNSRAGIINIDFSSLPNTYTDAKPITFLKNIGFLVESVDGLEINPKIENRYRDRLKNLKVYVVDKNVPLLNSVSAIVGIAKKINLLSTLQFISPYLAAIRTKPFILLAGISGTGKSRMVRQLARGCCPRFRSGTDEDHPLYDEQKPGNFEMIPVRPNWHDSTELMGYVSRISGSPKYVITDFIRFLAKAWLYEKEGIPFFLCLDEMNLAPVEQYFAEFLSVIETRKKDADGRIVTDTLVKINDNKLLEEMLNELYLDKAGEASDIISKFKEAGGISIPSNLVVMGTVNMDETTCTFSRKVLDRAMSFELNDVSDMYDLSNIDGEGDYEFGTIDLAAAKQSLTTGKEACDTAKDICGKVLGYLKAVNEKLDKTAFKIAYRSRNEIMIYCLERINGDVVSLAEALDEATSMKILSRIEGDSQHVTEKWLGELSELISAELAKIDGYDESKCDICRGKLGDMKEQVQSGYTSFWMR